MDNIHKGRNTRTRAEWITGLKQGKAKLVDCPRHIQEIYEVVHAACSSENDKTRNEALQMAAAIDKDWNMDKWLRWAAGVGEKPPQTNHKICVSKKFAMKEHLNPFSLNVLKQMREHEPFKSLQIYDPDEYNKSFCKFIEGGKEDGQIDWGDVTARSWPCRGGSTCKLHVLSNCGRPTTGSCWRYSYQWHVQKTHDNGGVLLQIVELVEGQLQLGDGQVIEEEMAHELGIPILRIEEKAEKDIETIVEEAAQSYNSKKWDDRFTETTIGKEWLKSKTEERARDALLSNATSGRLAELLRERQVRTKFREAVKKAPADKKEEMGDLQLLEDYFVDFFRGLLENGDQAA